MLDKYWTMDWNDSLTFSPQSSHRLTCETWKFLGIPEILEMEFLVPTTNHLRSFNNHTVILRHRHSMGLCKTGIKCVIKKSYKLEYVTDRSEGCILNARNRV